MSYVNVRRVMLRHKRAAKCPLLTKFLSQCVTSEEGNFVSTSELFSAYETAVSIWTDDDSVDGQTKFLMKRSSFSRVSIFLSLLCMIFSPWEILRANHPFKVKLVSAILNSFKHSFFIYV